MIERLRGHFRGLQKEASELVWLIAVRLAVLGMSLLFATLSLVVEESPVLAGLQVLYVPVGILFAFTAVSAWWLERVKNRKVFVLLQLTADLALVLCALYATGGPISPFQFLFLPLVAAAAFLLPLVDSLIFAVAAGVMYSTLGVALWSRFLAPAHPLQEAFQLDGGRLAIQSVGLWSALILVTVACAIVRKRLASQFALARESQASLERLSEQQLAIVEGMQEATVLFSEVGIITRFNNSAKLLFGDDVCEWEGKRVSQWLKHLAIPIGDSDLATSRKHATEIAVTYQGKTTTMACSWVNVRSSDGLHLGGSMMFRDVTKLRTMEDQIEMQERMARLLAEKTISSERGGFGEFVGETPVMRKVYALIERVAGSDATVLVTGESGTGKELVASAIHSRSPRKQAPFVAVNCGAIPENLIESELFGHKRGSFTGAVSDHTGLLRRANGGTVFLDEIGELPISMQAKLLRALQERKVRPVGSDSTVPIDVRIIAATNRDLKAETEKETFRQDLYYRLNVVGIHLPPLRDRRDDIPLLIEGFLKRVVSPDRPLPIITPGAMSLLMRYDYPGNVRELENILERSLVLGGEAVLPEHLPEVLEGVPYQDGTPTLMQETQIVESENIEFPVDLDQVLSEIERHYLTRALEQSGGVKKRAAELLGINFRSFRYRLQKFDIQQSGE